jgi:RNA polymerase sigma-70 factor (ECF subfamily)
MLQAVLGLDAARIASAFLVKPAAMGQRLSRAKTKIRGAGIAFDLPDDDHLAARLGPVRDAIYAAFGAGWDDPAAGDAAGGGLAAEALQLGRLLATAMPGDAEALGLLALMLHCSARAPARRDASGAFVPLSDQDPSRWSSPLMDEAERCLFAAARLHSPGRYQLEAAIQSVHARRAVTGTTDWEAIALLYEGLVRLAPSIGALVGRAAAVSAARGPSSGWALLGALPDAAVAQYQPYWALVAHLHRDLGRWDAARSAYRRAIGLCTDPAQRTFLITTLDAMERRVQSG